MLADTPLAPIILLAEDCHRSRVRKLPCNLFRDWGYCVLEAAHGLEALYQARKCEGRIDILIAEYNLPFIDGWELAVHVRKLFPSVKVLLIVGETEAFNRISPSVAVLHEPVEYSALMNKLRSLLGRTAAGCRINTESGLKVEGMFGERYSGECRRL